MSRLDFVALLSPCLFLLLKVQHVEDVDKVEGVHHISGSSLPAVATRLDVARVASRSVSQIS